MVTVSIETFLACSLIVAVVVGAMAMTAKIVAPYTKSLENLNEEEYLSKITEYVIVNTGSPADWGKNETLTPENFGLARCGSSSPYELDVDKISRLNSQNTYALAYLDILETLKLERFALRITVSQSMNIFIALTSIVTLENSTEYSFRISVSRDGWPVTASLHGYTLARDFINNTFANTSNDGEGFLNVTIPNSSNGTATLIVFARAHFNSRMTAYGVYAFGHLSSESPPNNSFLDLSPLDYTLYMKPKYSEISLETSYTLSYGYESNLTQTSDTTFTIPKILDSSPLVLIVTGLNSSTFFIEWAAYPQIPLQIGANFENAECFTFSYIITVNRVIYRMNLQCGGPSF